MTLSHKSFLSKTQPNLHKTLVQNRRAKFHYFIEDTLESGIVLYGTEIKALRMGRVSIDEAYAAAMKGELYVFNMYIAEYQGAGQYFQHKVRRPRKLLVHRREQKKLLGSVKQKGMTLLPLSLYFNTKGLVKVLLGLVRGKKLFDKREVIKEREWKRQKMRILKN